MGHIPVDWRSLANFIFQLSILTILLVGFTFARKGNYKVHEKFMTTALILAAVSLSSWMAVSFIIYFDAFVKEFYSTGVLITLIHVAIGVTAGSLTVYNVLNVKGRLPKRIATKNVLRTMRITFSVWLTAFALGTSFFVYYFVL